MARHSFLHRVTTFVSIFEIRTLLTPYVLRLFFRALNAHTAKYQFNPSVLETSSKTAMIWRTVDENGKRQLSYASYSKTCKSLRLASLSDQIYKLSPEISWVGDARLFEWQGKMYVAFDTGHSESPNRMFIIEVEDSGHVIRKPKLVIRVGERREIEKNWAFFESDNKLFTIYTHNPLEILELSDVSDDKMIFTSVISHQWSALNSERIQGEVRGTSTPVIIGDTFLSVAHSASDCNGMLTYSSHFLFFQASYPFSVTGFFPQSFKSTWKLYLIKPRKMLNKAVRNVIFPSGVFIHGRYLVISYGINDFRIGIRIFRVDAIKKLSRIGIKKNI